MKKPKKKQHIKVFAIKAIWVSILTIVIVKSFFSWFSSNYSFAHDDQENRCLPEYTTYFLEKHYSNVEVGGIYGFRAKGLEPFIKDGTWLAKYVVATSGDKVDINKNGIFINGEMKAEGFALAKRLGKAEESFYRTFTIPENKAFFMGTSEISYDSRYYGLVDYSKIIGEAHPLW